MPTLINGCGTSYGFKANLESHPGVCDACGFAGSLDQYDTRLCVTLVFLPLLPFRRLRILDECPRCKRHRVAKLGEYEMNRQLGVSAALADWQQNPSVEKAVAAHQAMRAFRQQGHAERFMRELQQRFHQDARLKAYHGTMLLEQGRKEEARLQLNEALKLRPELAEARVPMSRILMDDGDPDGAFKMLEFMLHPGSSQLYSLGPLEHLAMYLQPNNRQPEALRIFQHLVEELPAVAQVPAFRASVERTEKALRIKQSVLPPKKFSMHEVLFGTRTKLTKWVLFLAVAALFFSLRNFWIAGHRTIHVVNAWTEPVSLRISPDRTITVPPGRSTFTLAEGNYRIGVSGAVEEVIPLEVNTGFWGRWTKHPLWVLNPGGVAVLVESTLTITGRDLTSNGRKPVPDASILAGQRVMIFDDVEYAFTDLPKSVSLKRGEMRHYHQVTSYDGDLTRVAALLSERDPATALKVAFAEMQRHPGDAQLREAVAKLMQKPELAESYRAFLESQSKPAKPSPP